MILALPFVAAFWLCRFAVAVGWLVLRSLYLLSLLTVGFVAGAVLARSGRLQVRAYHQ